jgi:N-methylhydantoinase A
MHAVALAAGLEITTVLVPPSPGTLSALGLLATPLAADVALTRLMSDPDPAEVSSLLDELCRQAREVLAHQGVDPAAVIRRIDCRYRGQAHEVPVEVEADVDMNRLAEGLAAGHRARFGWDAAGEPVELVTFRVRATGPDPGLRLPEVAPGSGARPAEHVAGVPAYLRSDLGAGDRIAGPCLVWGEDSSVVVEDGWGAEVTRRGSLLIQQAG